MVNEEIPKIKLLVDQKYHMDLLKSYPKKKK